MTRWMFVLALAACGGGRVAAPPPARPIAPEPAGPERPAAEVCGALVTDLERYRACIPDDRKEDLDAWIDRARVDVAALSDPSVPDADRAAAARACAKADVSLRAALARCAPGA